MTVSDMSLLTKLRHAFTLIELIVVMVIITVLAALLIPAVAEARKRADRLPCAANLRQIGLSMIMYTADEDGFFPCVHGRDYSNPLPAEQEWWEMLEDYGMHRAYMLCPGDPHADHEGHAHDDHDGHAHDDDTETVESYSYNGMFAFHKRCNQVVRPVEKILISERSDSELALEHQGYPAWKRLSEWEDLIEHARHGGKSNYLFVDGHVAAERFHTTIGEAEDNGHCNDTNWHYLPEFDPPVQVIIPDPAADL
jgi:prepilin-type processing-associated H-X9-DG protein/prepilin-type N-terminal cleavage/methylation domain-containing protein